MESDSFKPQESIDQENKKPKKGATKTKPVDKQESLQSISVDEKQQKITDQTSVISITKVRAYTNFVHEIILEIHIFLFNIRILKHDLYMYVGGGGC